MKYRISQIAILVLVLLAACASPPDSLNGSEQGEESTYIQDAVNDYVGQQTHVIITIPYMQDNSGSVNELGGLQFGVDKIYPGDSADENIDFESFISFDVSDLAGVTLLSAVVSFDYCIKNGNPFHKYPFGLGLLHVESLNYGELDAEDYLGNDTAQHVIDLNDCPVDAIDVITFVNTNMTLFQLRLYFDNTNNDGIRDDVVFANPELTVEFIR